VAERNAPRVLAGFAATVHGQPALPLQVCAAHLALLGAETRCAGDGNGEAAGREPLVVGNLAVHRRRGGKGAAPAIGTDCLVRWLGSSAGRSPAFGSEAIVQALSGLMGLHGRDRRAPRRIGLEIASVATGVVATQAVLAALIAQSRGLTVQGIETSVLQAALLFLRHHLAIATCGGRFPLRLAEDEPGPPFPTADGHWIELEALSPDAWIGFWQRLGLDGSETPGAAWLPFVYRYLAGRCSLPAALHQATARHTLAEISQAAEASGVALRRLRAYDELLAETGQRAETWQAAPWTLSSGAGRRRARAASALGSAPLAGLRVIEVTSRLQGPLAGLLLLMLGADVLKVEPLGGDFGRGSPPIAGSVGAAYLAYNHGKRVIEIDYKQPEGRAHLASLAAEADVFLHNWLDGRAERLGLDHRDLARHNPRLVYAHASGWGKTGAGSSIAGDYLVQAHAGCGEGLNPSDEPPFPSRLTLIDVMGGLLACEGILAGLYLRERNGRGCRVDTSLLAGALILQAHVLQAMARGQEAGRRRGRPLWGILDRPLATADGFLILEAVGEPAQRRAAKLCGLGSLAGDGLLERQIAERLRTRPAAEWESVFNAAGIPAAVVRSDLGALPEDPRAAGLLEHADGACWVPRAPWRFQT